MWRALCVALAAAAAGLRARRVYSNPVYNQTFFPALDNYQVNATSVTEAQYPWVARVVHSRSRDVPLACTAACVQPRIFVTSSRCVYNLKVHYTTILYQNTRHQSIAFVVPRNESKQAFDDIGFVVVADGYKGTWATIALIDRNRTDDEFKWFDEMNLSFGLHDHRAVGYATRKGMHKIRSPEKIYELKELQVIVGIGMCKEILTVRNRINGFFVPCYHSCSVHDFRVQMDNCKKYLGVEGGAVIDAGSGRLIGISTWGAYFHKYELPVGFSVPNSENFFKDYECAIRIRNDEGILVSTGHYQSLCPD